MRARLGDDPPHGLDGHEHVVDDADAHLKKS
jgi:hypothetical protein